MIGQTFDEEHYSTLCNIKAACIEDVLGNMCDEANERDKEEQNGLIESRLEMITAIMNAPTIKATFQAFWESSFSVSWKDFVSEIVSEQLGKIVGDKATRELIMEQLLNDNIRS